MLTVGKLNILIDAMFGSTGKGLVSNYVAINNTIDISVTNAGPNSGHTFYIGDKKCVTRQLPVSGILQNNIIFLCAGAIINPSILLEEIKEFNIDPNRVFVHPRAAIINEEDIIYEQEGFVKSIASTLSGTGRAAALKLNRSAVLAENDPIIKHLVKPFNLQKELDKGLTAFFETPQGLDLSLNSGLAYPYCTSREITVSAVMSEAQLHPSYLGKVISCIRTFPIRVGHIVNEDNEIVGNSGPFYDDSIETTWEEIGVSPEYTTNTKRIRRVATFSMKQYQHMLDILKPDYVFLNFVNYLSSVAVFNLIKKLPEVTHLGYGCKTSDVVTLTEIVH